MSILAVKTVELTPTELEVLNAFRAEEQKRLQAEENARMLLIENEAYLMNQRFDFRAAEKAKMQIAKTLLLAADKNKLIQENPQDGRLFFKTAGGSVVAVHIEELPSSRGWMNQNKTYGYRVSHSYNKFTNRVIKKPETILQTVQDILAYEELNNSEANLLLKLKEDAMKAVKVAYPGAEYSLDEKVSYYGAGAVRRAHTSYTIVVKYPKGTLYFSFSRKDDGSIHLRLNSAFVTPEALSAVVSALI